NMFRCFVKHNNSSFLLIPLLYTKYFNLSTKKRLLIKVVLKLITWLYISIASNHFSVRIQSGNHRSQTECHNPRLEAVLNLVPDYYFLLTLLETHDLLVP